MKNALYEGLVVHQRLEPRPHSFRYKVNYFYFDIDNISDLITFKPFLTFSPKNYLSSKEIKAEIKKHLGDGHQDVQSVFILTQLSYFGLCFNPVSFYYCFNEKKELLYVVSQITNTPWNEKHIDVIDFQKNTGEAHFPKNFHVSPFMPMEVDYSWKLSLPSETLKIKMLNKMHGHDKHFFNAEMNLKRKEYTSTNVLLSLLRFPLMSFKIIAGIYWQAFILYLKKIPFYAHPKKREAL